ncbi:hypothetical protein H0484_02980 [Pusillimonas sp. CC-YST705]|uniref:Uncharacterized protein n=1 Tax=Mesopusillimonas faecipullorum TaxID=2755040 RepID=A0ABS8CA50_9BURK|nr:hypothetical protein [Mesopusillimonas faecipullorum]
MATVVGAHLKQTARLIVKHGPVLLTVLLGAKLLEDLLMNLAVELGMIQRFAGLVAVIMLILLQLIVFVGMFVILRGQPLQFRRKPSVPSAASPPEGDTPLFAGAVLAVLIPFYGYYAGWGFLGNTLRDYSRAFLSEQWNRIDFLNPQDMGPTALEVDGTLWLLLPVAIIWWVRRMAKARYAQTGHQAWPLVVVACEATWVIIALYVLSGWKQQFVAWLASLPSPTSLLDWFLPSAEAALVQADVRPVDWPQWQLSSWLSELFRYALLPLIWFNLGAIVYGHNLNVMAPPTERVAGRVTQRWAALPKPLTDFFGHFWAGVIKRWHAVANGVLLAASAGVWLTVSILVLWRLADWAGRWLWLGMAHLIGPQDLQVWNLVVVPLNLLFGMPGQPQTGVLVVMVQFCVLAAGLNLALASQRAAKVSA